MKKKLGLVVSILCVALCAVVLSCASGGGGGGKSASDLGANAFDVTGEYGTFDDHEAPNNGTSTAEITSAEETIDGETATVYTITGNVTTKYIYGFCGWVVTPDEETFARFQKASGFSFKVLGDGKRYAIKYKTKECESDYCYYEYGFNTEPGVAVTIEVPIKFFQQPSWGQWKRLNQESVTGVEFQTHENWRKSADSNPFEVKFWDFKVYTN
jgi:hypothetical protein